MAKVVLAESTFSIIPEGEHVLKVVKAEYDEVYGKMKIHMQNQKGEKHLERFTLVGASGQPNEKAINAFSYFAKKVLNDFTVKEIDEQDLVGHFVKGTIIHTKSPKKDDPTKTVTFANLKDIESSEGWQEAPAETPTTSAPQLAHSLDDILG